jgi:oligoendopeptidase F
MNLSADIKKIERNFLPEVFSINKWSDLQPFFDQLVNREINNRAELEQWLKDLSELEAVVSEDYCWRHIRMTCDTENEAIKQSFIDFASTIQPEIQVYADQLNKKLLAVPYLSELDKDLYFTYIRSIQKSIDLFREENIPLTTKLSVKQQEYGGIVGALTVEVDGQEYTLQQAAKYLEHPDRAKRESVYRQIQEKRLTVKDKLDDLFNELIQLRHQVAKNAGYENYVDYKFKELGRFDYSESDCIQFHTAVKTAIMPLVDKIYQQKKKDLGLNELRPWDLEALPANVKPLKPFTSGDELLAKSISCFEKVNPFFADCLKKMKAMNHFDLDSRKGKAPGGYNCPLAESGAPFIFMNAAGQMSDVITMVHEGGHAVHSFLAHPLPLTSFKEYPMEIAEVASMSMELFTMDEWDTFFENADELKRAKFYQFERVITIFPWIATIDKFQFWLYKNPQHTAAEREAAWVSIFNEFTSKELNIDGLELYRKYFWQKQLHLFEVPFYYIEYGIAQLGAIGLYAQYKENKERAIENYINALKLGNTKTLPELYQAAGLKFDFSEQHIAKLMQFVQKEMETL